MAEIATDLGDRDKRTLPVQRTSNQRALILANPSWCADNGDIDAARPQFLTPGLNTWGVTNGRGYRWADHFGEMTGIHTILPPNGEMCADRNQGGEVLCPPSSRHQGGAHVMMGDGAVKFITDSIEAGNKRAGMVWQGGIGLQVPGSVSPYGLWGALGTQASKETIQGF